MVLGNILASLAWSLGVPILSWWGLKIGLLIEVSLSFIHTRSHRISITLHVILLDRLVDLSFRCWLPSTHVNY
jgi:hypothetical protein